MIPLPDDITRCYGTQCHKKHQCARFTTMRHDQPKPYIYVTSLIDTDGACDSFIQDKTHEHR
ncbi:hypothetical protein [Methylomonas sp. 11b]|uniref:hypothetical protein n=1 Tax=Methylomonas sp. 11b TaxID=1168169 RepID=UPI0004BB4E9B|nr:hypothetical protein [Methylomonas sp. 11b]